MFDRFIALLTDFGPWIALGSLVSLVVGVLALPFLTTRIPADYFSHQRRHRMTPRGNPLSRLLLAIVQNIIGAVLVIAGLLMLVLPGQGLLTLAAGLMIMNYPGKYALERWLIMRPYVLPAINALRSRYQVPELQAPDSDAMIN